MSSPTASFGKVREQWAPHSYQERAIHKMLQQRAVGLFMDPGLGKTSTVLSAFKIMKESGLVNRMLVVAPLRPMYNVWPAEIEKWADFCDLKWCILHGPKKDKMLDWDADVFLINPEGIQWLMNFERRDRRIHTDGGKLDRLGVDVLCIDESTRFKSASSNRFKAIRNHLARFKLRWCLTGTPSPNRIEDLFGQVFILDQGRALGQYITHFRNRFMYPHPRNQYQWEAKEGAFDQITELVAPLVVRLKAEDHLDMPELINNNIVVTLPDRARSIYNQVYDDFISMMDEGVILANNAAAAGTKCRQIANGAVYSNLLSEEAENDEWMEVHPAKLEALEELLEELGDQPVLLLYEYRHDAERIMALLGDRCANLSGASPKKAQEYIERFNNGLLPVLLGHPASMGHGLNLQGFCKTVVWFGITWNLEHYLQAIARVYRQGQKSDSVVVHHIVAEDTLDERVLRVLQTKDNNQRTLLSALAGRAV